MMMVAVCALENRTRQAPYYRSHKNDAPVNVEHHDFAKGADPLDGGMHKPQLLLAGLL